MSINLFDFKENRYSQNGEDGIITKLLSTAQIENGFFVELGAWDGKRWSNTYRLYENGWSGCLIEENKDRFRQLCANVPDDCVLKINARVAESGANALDNILGERGIGEIDLLAIDVDSNDLRIWESVQRFDPGIVLIEYNPVIPFDTRYVNPQGEMHGNSALSIHESARDRGYVLVEGTDTNLIFARPRIINGTEVAEKSLQAIQDQTFQLRYFFGYDGTLLHTLDTMNKNELSEIYPVPWSLTFGLQPIPKLFRKYTPRVNYPGLILFFAISVFRCPVQLVRLIRLMIARLSKGRRLSEIVALLMRKEELTSALKDDDPPTV